MPLVDDDAVDLQTLAHKRRLQVTKVHRTVEDQIHLEQVVPDLLVPAV